MVWGFALSQDSSREKGWTCLVVDRLGKLWLEVSLTPGLVVLEKYLVGTMWRRGQIWIIGGVEELLWPMKPA